MAQLLIVGVGGPTGWTFDGAPSFGEDLVILSVLQVATIGHLIISSTFDLDPDGLDMFITSQVTVDPDGALAEITSSFTTDVT